MLYKSFCILISGKLGSGKSTLAGYLLDEFYKLNYNAVVTSFALPIKIIARDYIGWDGEKDAKGRKLLQELGTDVGRSYNETCWADWLFNKYIPKQSKYPFDIVIIDDWRFPNEAGFVESLGLYSVFKTRINRLGDMSGNEHNHASENALPEHSRGYYDLVYINGGDLTSLRRDSETMANVLHKNNLVIM